MYDHEKAVISASSLKQEKCEVAIVTMSMANNDFDAILMMMMVMMMMVLSFLDVWDVMLIFIFLLHHDPMCYFYFPPKPPNSRYTLGIHASLFAWSPPVQDMLLPLWPFWGPVRAPQPDSPQLLHTLQTIQLQTAESVSQFSMS